MKRIILSLLLIGTIGCISRKAPAEGCAHIPVIGISCSRTDSGMDRLAPAYSDAVKKAGGVPLMIPTLDNAADVDAVLDVLDGLILSGGEDVNPAWYGEDVLNSTVDVDSVRDRSDSLLATCAMKRGMPILAICRGEQLMNILLGGSLYQDIPSQVEGHVDHSGGAIHPVLVERGTLLYDLFGKDTLVVNSFHHQAVKAPAPGIRVSARSVDGIVEAFEAEGILAVQFHPEKLVQSGDDSFLAPFLWLTKGPLNAQEAE